MKELKAGSDPLGFENRTGAGHGHNMHDTGFVKAGMDLARMFNTRAHLVDLGLYWLAGTAR